MNMFPGFSLANQCDCRLVNPKNTGHFLLGQSGLCANPEHVVISELGVSTFHSARSPSSLNHFSRVIRTSSQVKMCRLNADRPITPMQNALTGRNCTTVNLVGHTMCPNGCLMHPEQAMTKFSGATHPVPTSFSERGSRWWITRHEPGKHFSLSHSFRAHPSHLTGAS